MVIIERDQDAFEGYGSTIDERNLIDCLYKKVAPIYSTFYGNEYRGSVLLKDGTFFPCVAFRHKKRETDLIYNALHKKHFGNRIGDENRPYDQEFVQKNIIGHRITNENIIRFDSDIIKVEKCNYTLSDKIIKTLTLQPTYYFVAKFKDGSFENFHGEEGNYYEVPENKNLEEIVEIYNSTLVTTDNELIELKNYMDWKSNEKRFKKIHVAKPYFSCYIGHFNDFDDENHDGFKDEINKIWK